ncbi:hypothetical protein AB0C71_39450 [Streptomyces anulatus]|uniref:hypothetical protein n=1 Tax=Streptomyces anulatus TaxID=1892 RepID=UPI00340574AE
MGNRRINRQLTIAQDKLDRLNSGDSTALSAGDQAKLAGLMGVGFVRATKLKGAPAAERAADRIWANARQRAAADVRVLEGESQKSANDEAAARRQRRGWF